MEDVGFYRLRSHYHYHICQLCWEEEEIRNSWPDDDDVRHLETGLAGLPLDRMLAYQAQRLAGHTPETDHPEYYWPPRPDDCYSVDGGIIRHGRVPPDDDDDWKRAAGLCIINPE